MSRFDLDLYLQGCLTVTLPISWIIFMCHKCNPWRDNVSRFISRSKVRVTQVVRIFAVWAGGILVEISDLQFLVIAE